MRNLLFGVTVLGLALQGCGETSFEAGAVARAAAGKPNKEQPTPETGDVAPGQLPTDTAPDEAPQDVNDPLPQTCSEQSILILDFKSGWWEGDGGDTFSHVIQDELQASCPNSTPEVEYHHIILGGAPKAKFYDKDFNSYTQVWVLSGSLADIADIRLNHAGFQDLLRQIEQFKPRLFLGAGFGSVDHSNEVAKLIWGQDIFTTLNKRGEIVTVNQDGSNVTIKTHTTPDVKGSLFTGVPGDIVDHVDVGGQYVPSDALVTGAEGVQILSYCQDEAMQTAPCIGIGAANGYRFVLDAGLQRFYSLYVKKEQNTKLYLRNIIRALAQ